MDFSVNFMEKATAVLNEAFALKKYKAMPLVLAIIVGIFMLPFAVAGMLLAAALYVMGYLFSIVSLPVQSLHKLLKEEGASVGHATQFIIYFLSWSFVFTAYALLTFFMVSLTVLYSVFSIITYIWTLGGFKFHVLTSEEDISIQVNGKYAVSVPVIFVVVMAVLLIVVPLLKTVITIDDYQLEVDFEDFMNIFKYQMASVSNWRILFSALYAAFIFAPQPKKKLEE